MVDQTSKQPLRSRGIKAKHRGSIANRIDQRLLIVVRTVTVVLELRVKSSSSLLMPRSGSGSHSTIKNRSMTLNRGQSRHVAILILNSSTFYREIYSFAGHKDKEFWLSWHNVSRNDELMSGAKSQEDWAGSPV